MTPYRLGTIVVLSLVSTLLLGMVATAGTPSPAQPQSSQTDGELKFVVALFRHGVRAPLAEFAAKAGKHSGKPWPSIEEWFGPNHSGDWGFLTPHGADAVIVLGEWYGKHYAQALGPGFKAYLWADVDERTEATAAALAAGLGKSGACVQLESLYLAKADPLFHPYAAMCGKPDAAKLKTIEERLAKNCDQWLISNKSQLSELNYVLNCDNTCDPAKPCEPLGCVGCPKKPTPTPTPTPTSAATPTPRPSSPLKWDGEFSYASSATEAFLLEYANGTEPAWNRLKSGALANLLQLHEFYFQQTERDPYMAGIQGANLIREISAQLNRKAGQPLADQCPRGGVDDQFVGLVGHDTNLAHLNTLLNVHWSFKNTRITGDTHDIPDDDALPAGALVFELRKDSAGYRVRINYVTQSLDEIKDAPKPSDAYQVKTFCGDKSPCEMSLDEFKTRAEKVLGTYGEFLSHCDGDKQTCR